MLEERKTHYSDDTKYCDRLGKEVLLEQIRAPGGIVIVQCRFFHLDGCYANFDARKISTWKPKSCSLNSKLVNVIRS